MRTLAALLLVLAAPAFVGCATCRPEEPKVEPRVGGSIGTGTGGTWTSTGVGFDLTNLFCRDPEPEDEPSPQSEDAVPQAQ